MSRNIGISPFLDTAERLVQGNRLRHKLRDVESELHVASEAMNLA